MKKLLVLSLLLSTSAFASDYYDALMEKFDNATAVPTIEDFEALDRCYQVDFQTQNILKNFRVSTETKTIDNGPLFPGETFKVLNFGIWDFAFRTDGEQVISTDAELELWDSFGSMPKFAVRLHEDGNIYFYENYIGKQPGYCVR